MRRVVVIPGVIAGVIAALLLALLSACTGSSSPAAQAPTMASVRGVLSSYAAAVRSRDENAYVAALDPKFATFRAAQLIDYQSLSRLPFRIWRYVVVGEINDPAANRAARAQYSGPVRLVHVTLEFALRGVEPQPSRHDLYLVFTERDGHTYVAGDDAVTGESISSWVGPWRDGPLIAVPGARSLVLGPPTDETMLRELAREIDAGVAGVSRVWGPNWSQHVIGLLAASSAEFTALTGSSAEDDSAAAVTDGIDSGTGRPYGQRLVLNPAQLARLTSLGRRIVLTHEITHLATAADTADITPRWLVEGFAEYVANLGTGQSVRLAAAELHTAVAAHHLPTALPDDGAFAASGAALAQQYEQSWLACRLIAKRAGQAGLVRFYREVGTALSPRAEAIAHAFASVLHETEAAFTARWRAYLTAQLG